MMKLTTQTLPSALPLALAAITAVPAMAQRDPSDSARIEFTSGTIRTDVLLPRGEVLLELRAASTNATITSLDLGRDRLETFRDDGLGFDRRARDGVFTGVAPADLDAEIETFERLQRSLSTDRPFQLFDGRHLGERVPSSSLLPAASFGTIPILTQSNSVTVDPDRSLMITDPGVLDDPAFSFNPCTQTGNPNGVWTFGHVMTELAGGMNPSDFCHEWLDHWTVDQTINGSVSPQRQLVHDEILSNWPTLGNGDLDMTMAPFRPIAIVLRIDLRSSIGYGQGNAGEARIVYCYIDANCNPRKFLPIFEYAINKSGCDIKAWGEDWADLSTMVLGSAQYNTALAALTTQFTDVTSSPNANGLGQLRTNEFLVNPWELREFHLDAGSGLLTQTTVALTPDVAHNNTNPLGDIINGVSNNLPNILGASALTGFSSNAGQPAAFWRAPNVIDNDDRHDFSLNTCSGCHKRETDTFFTHVSEAGFGSAAPLSGFLTGITVTDPVVTTVQRTFNDLDRRRQDLQNLIDTSCLSQVMFAQHALTH